MRILQRLFFVISLLVQGHIAFAQVVFNLRPYIGMQAPFARMVDNGAGINTFANNRLNLNIDYSLFLEANFKKSSRLSLGYTNGGIKV